ncbi:ricin-type beta-trefoil lectin domain protein [Kitasatospora purpeofusca]|uniref:ricin-type beta-trefoil lectin domain protein n=1 Tax=Kitasatospora purpeofusca TaxID=67352 RepID=UPI00364F3CDD
MSGPSDPPSAAVPDGESPQLAASRPHLDGGTPAPGRLPAPARFSDSFLRHTPNPPRGLLPQARVWTTTAAAAALVGAVALGSALLPAGNGAAPHAARDAVPVGPAITTTAAAPGTPDPADGPPSVPPAPEPSADAPSAPPPAAEPAPVTADPVAAEAAPDRPGATDRNSADRPAAPPPAAARPQTRAPAPVGTADRPAASAQAPAAPAPAAQPPAAQPAAPAAPPAVTTQAPAPPAAAPAPAPAPTTQAPAPAAPAPPPGRPVAGRGSQRCIGTIGHRLADGVGLELQDCTGGAWQTWDFRPDGTVRAGELCMDVAWGSVVNGTKIQVAICNGSPAQRFVLAGPEDLVNPQANKCVDAKDKGTAAGTPLQLWDCSGTPNQKWYLR